MTEVSTAPTISLARPPSVQGCPRGSPVTKRGTPCVSQSTYASFFFSGAAAAVLSAMTLTVILAAGGFPAVSAARSGSGSDGASAQGVATKSSLLHRLKTCLPAGRAKPTVVLVHGAWADASSWGGEVTALHAAGYDARAIANPLQDLTTDPQYVADYLKTIHRPVVLVGHSYGGAVITNAAAALANVDALVYVDASAPAPGETNGSLSGTDSILSKRTPAQLFFTTSYPGAPAGASQLYLKQNIFIHNFANDIPRAEAKRLWASQRGASTVAFDTPSRAAAWKTIPSWYFISTGDQIITPPPSARWPSAPARTSPRSTADHT